MAATALAGRQFIGGGAFLLPKSQERRRAGWDRGNRRLRDAAWWIICPAGFTVLVLQPIQVKAYGRVHLRRAKNDRLEAILIAVWMAAIDQARIAPDPRLAKLADI